MLAAQDREYEHAFDAMLAAQHAKVGPYTDQRCLVQAAWLGAAHLCTSTAGFTHRLPHHQHSVFISPWTQAAVIR